MVGSGAGEVELQRSSATISIDGKEAVQGGRVRRILGRVLRGLVTLESLALPVDPLTRTLKGKMLYGILLESKEVDFRGGVPCHCQAQSAQAITGNRMVLTKGGIND